jgi:prepilin signal peptidase PulO-like enzyme (type II secretory pathway)
MDPQGNTLRNIYLTISLAWLGLTPLVWLGIGFGGLEAFTKPDNDLARMIGGAFVGLPILVLFLWIADTVRRRTRR